MEGRSTARSDAARRSVARICVIYLNSSVSEPWRALGSEPATGSGWFLRLPHQHPREPPRYLLTCSHVVHGVIPENGMFVQTQATGDAKIRCRVVAAMPDIDAALLELLPTQDVDMGSFDAWTLGDDREVRMGDPVMVYGYPLSQDRMKVAASRVNGREVGLLQLDGAVNHGHSGGPVVWTAPDGSEVVVGWVALGVPDANAVSFAQPIGAFLACVPAIPLERGPTVVVRKRTLGVRYFAASRDRLISVGARGETCSVDSPCDCESGVVIQWVSSTSPLRAPPFNAEPGDIICSVSASLVDPADPPVYVTLDDRGTGVLPWSEEGVDLSVVMGMVPMGSPVRVSLWKSTQRRLVKGSVLPTDAFVNGYFMPYRPHQETPYEIFAGMIVAALTAEVLREFPALNDRLSMDEKELPRLVVVRVFLGGALNAGHDEDNDAMDEETIGGSKPNIFQGAIVESVNGFRVHDIEGYRAALREPVGGRFLQVDTRDGRGDVVAMDKVLHLEPLLAEQYGFPLSDVYRSFVPA